MPKGPRDLLKRGRDLIAERFATAQKNAALPIEQGGLGLHPDNTPMERAKAMGYTFARLNKTDWPAVPVEVHYTNEIPRQMFIDANGQARLILPGAYKGDRNYLSTRTFRDVDNMLSPLKENEYIRVSDNPNDIVHIQQRTHRGSKNWATGEGEGGLSVAKSPEFGANNEYIVTGTQIGHGSDSEPLLDINSVNYVGKLDRDKYKSDLLEKANREYGLTPDDVRDLLVTRINNRNAGDIPAGTRSKLAAFDPLLKNSLDILASAAPVAVGLGILGTGLSSQDAMALPSEEVGSIRPVEHPWLDAAANAIDKYVTLPIPLAEKPLEGVANYLRNFGRRDAMGEALPASYRLQNALGAAGDLTGTPGAIASTGANYLIGALRDE